MSTDAITAADGLSLSVGSSLPEKLGWACRWMLRKYDERATGKAARQGFYRPTDEDFAELGLEPYAEVLTVGNNLTTAGLGRIATLLNAGTGNLISSTTARVGAGNGSTAFAIGDTDLSAAAGSANRWFQAATVTIPSNVLTFAATFASADGNFAWNEWGIDIGATNTSSNAVAAVLLNRKVASNGTKASGQTWTATATITIS
jgi:hypothetical protein